MRFEFRPANAQPADEYEPVEARYFDALLPGTNISLPSCAVCGALVINEPRHDVWHATQDGAL